MAEQSYDAIVVGSGANGGWAAKELCEAGMSVAVLELGRELDPATDFSEHTLPHELPLRGRQDPRTDGVRAPPDRPQELRLRRDHGVASSPTRSITPSPSRRSGRSGGSAATRSAVAPSCGVASRTA